MYISRDQADYINELIVNKLVDLDEYVADIIGEGDIDVEPVEQEIRQLVQLQNYLNAKIHWDWNVVLAFLIGAILAVLFA